MVAALYVEANGIYAGLPDVDLWDAERFATCQQCAPARIERMRSMNLHQRIEPQIGCECAAPGS